VRTFEDSGEIKSPPAPVIDQSNLRGGGGGHDSALKWSQAGSDMGIAAPSMTQPDAPSAQRRATPKKSKGKSAATKDRKTKENERKKKTLDIWSGGNQNGLPLTGAGNRVVELKHEGGGRFGVRLLETLINQKKKKKRKGKRRRGEKSILKRASTTHKTFWERGERR